MTPSPRSTTAEQRIAQKLELSTQLGASLRLALQSFSGETQPTPQRILNRQRCSDFPQLDIAIDILPYRDASTAAFSVAAIVHDYAQASASEQEFIKQSLMQNGIDNALWWHRDRDARETTKRGAEQLIGITPEQLVIEVDSIRLLIKPFQTPSGGIFLDTQQVRQSLVNTSQDKRVLNLFCFTGSLGVAAARGGAREVVQVDISKSVLSWARENEALQDPPIPSGTFRYIADDAVAVLQRMRRRVERGEPGFNTILIDPPAFGASGRKRFDLSAMIPQMMEDALATLAPQGTLYFMCNETSISSELLRSHVPVSLRSQATDLNAPGDQFHGDPALIPMMRGIVIPT